MIRNIDESLYSFKLSEKREMEELNKNRETGSRNISKDR